MKKLLSKIFTGGLLLSIVALKAQAPVAGFSIIPTPLCTGGTYTIIDQSTNNPTAWSYSVHLAIGPGPGITQTFNSQNPTFTPQNPGTVTVTLVSTNSSGASAAVSQVFTVQAGPNANITPTNQNSCIGGNPITIQVTTGGGPGGGAVTYAWSTGTSGSSITVSPSVTTVYSCVVSATNGCSVTREATVTIGTPTVQITSVPANICPGTTSTLTVAGTGPGPKTFTWSNATTGNVITSSVAGVFSATMTNGQGCSGVQTFTLGTSTTLSLTASSTPSNLCSGNNAVLNVTGASNYTWSTGSTANNPTVNPTSTTTYTVTGQIGTCTGTTALTLNVSTIPTVNVVSNPVSLCAGGTATLSASGASAYTWTPGASTSSVIVVTANTSITYTVRGQNPGCPARNGTVALSVSPSPNVSIQSNTNTACAGEPVALSASGASNYQWSNGSNGGLIIVYPTVSSVYSVTGTSGSNCTGTASISVNVSDCTGINQATADEKSFSVYPNPSQGVVTVVAGKGTKLDVIDLTGQVIRSVSTEQLDNGRIHFSNLPIGIYFVRYTEGTKSVTQKLIVE
jgi:hypothetical protein